MALETYSFLNFMCAIAGPGGAFSLSGEAGVAEEGVTIEPAEDQNTMTPGADGQVMHSLHAARHGTVTVRLLKTSPVNGQLSKMYALQITSSALHGNNVITIGDSSRGDRITCQQVAFKRAPAINYAKVGGMQEWTFDCGRIDRIQG